MLLSLNKVIIATLLASSVGAANLRANQDKNEAVRELGMKKQRSSAKHTSAKTVIHELKKEIEDLKTDVNTMKQGIKKNVIQKKNKGHHGKVAPTEHNIPSNRIVGGSPAGSGFDWFVNYGQFCGGSLIHPQVVLSAAHCDGPGSIRIGSNNFSSGGVTRSIKQRIKHPNYDDATTDNDYLLIYLDKPVTNIAPVALNNDVSQPENNEDLTVIGFGATSEGGSGSNQLLKVVVPVVSHQTCTQQYDGLNKDIHLCAGFAQGGKDSCQGDSGGPIVEYQGNTPVQVGVVSFGNGCAQPNASGVYARVSGAYDWIQQTVCDLTNDCAPGLTPGTVPAPAPTPNTNDNSPTFDASPISSPIASPTFDASPQASPISSPTFDASPEGSPISSPTYDLSPHSSPVWSPTWTDDGGWDDDWWNYDDDGNWDDDGSWWWNRALGGTKNKAHKKKRAAATDGKN